VQHDIGVGRLSSLRAFNAHVGVAAFNVITLEHAAAIAAGWRTCRLFRTGESAARRLHKGRFGASALLPNSSRAQRAALALLGDPAAVSDHGEDVLRQARLSPLQVSAIPVALCQK
jgi:hypothetical protein